MSVIKDVGRSGTDTCLSSTALPFRDFLVRNSNATSRQVAADLNGPHQTKASNRDVSSSSTGPRHRSAGGARLRLAAARGTTPERPSASPFRHVPNSKVL